MSWFVDTKELERKGARLLLLKLRDIETASVALQNLDQGASLEDVGYILNVNLQSAFTDQDQRIGELQKNLAWQKNLCESYQARAEHWNADPIHKQVAAVEKAMQEKLQQVIDLSYSVTSLQEILDRERRQYAQEVERLNRQLVEQNRLIAKQHHQLEQLTGSNTPE